MAPKTRRALSNPFAGLLTCPICGYAMTYHTTNNGFHSFNCKKYCSKVIKYSDLVSAVKTSLLTVHLPELEAKLKNGDGDAITIQQQIIDRLEKQMAELKKQEAKQYDLLETGIYSEEVFLERNAALRDKMTSCFTQLAEAKEKLPKSVDYAKKVRTLKEAIAALDDDTATVEQKNRLLKAVIKKMEYTSDKVQPHGQNEFKLRIDLNI